MIRTYYLRAEPKPGQKRGDPIACLMSQIDRAADVIRYALAVGHPKDDFFKSRGRMIAAARLQDRPRPIYTKMPQSGHDISRVIMNDIVAQIKLCDRYGLKFVQRHHAGDWFYHMPLRIQEAVQRWLDQATKPKTNVETLGTPSLINNPGMSKITCSKKDADKFLNGGNETFVPKAETDAKSWKTTSALCDIEQARMIQWMKDNRPSGNTEMLVKANVSTQLFTNPRQQEAWDYFQEQLTSLLQNKYFAGKFAVVVGRDVVQIFDTYESAFKFAVPRYTLNGANDFIIQQIIDQSQF
jgi:hypothetical protein